MTMYFYDTEFIENGETIDLISIGIVADDGRELYLQSTEFNAKNAEPWVKENVLGSLFPCPHINSVVLQHEMKAHIKGQCTFINPAKDIVGPHGIKLPELILNADCPWRTREEIKQEIIAFMNPEKYGQPELWGYYSAYDHVAFCQLFGVMMDLPTGYPMYTNDLMQLCAIVKGKDFPLQEFVKQENEHNAQDDARWNMAAWKYLMGINI